jgi:hypothetical protein
LNLLDFFQGSQQGFQPPPFQQNFQPQGFNASVTPGGGIISGSPLSGADVSNIRGQNVQNQQRQREEAARASQVQLGRQPRQVAGGAATQGISQPPTSQRQNTGRPNITTGGI